jgi:hypothetical protein
MRRVIQDALLSAGALLVLVTLLVAADGRLRDRVLHIGHTTADVAAAENQARDLAHVVVAIVGDAMRMHTTLMMFLIVATVLTVFMVRT